MKKIIITLFVVIIAFTATAQTESSKSRKAYRLTAKWLKANDTACGHSLSRKALKSWYIKTTVSDTVYVEISFKNFTLPLIVDTKRKVVICN